jgi:hypothetical protein
MAMPARWLQSLAASLGTVGGWLGVGLLGAALFLGVKLVKKLADRADMRPGPMLVGLLLVALLISRRFDSGHAAHSRPAAPPVAAKSRADSERQRLLERQRLQRQDYSNRH